jgi:hypothetical protein
MFVYGGFFCLWLGFMYGGVVAGTHLIHAQLLPKVAVGVAGERKKEEEKVQNIKEWH